MHHGFGGFTSDTVGKVYDSKIYRRLLGYIKPYKRLLGVSFILLVFISGFEISFPYLTKIGIDRYIVLRYHEIMPTRDSEALKVLSKYRPMAVVIAGKEFLDETKLKKWDREYLKKRKVLSQERYLVLNPQEFPAKRWREVAEIIRKYKRLFISEKGLFAISYSNLRKIPGADVKKLRAQDIHGVKLVALVFLVILVLNLIFTFSQVYILQYMSQLIMYDLRMDIMRHIFRLPVDFFSKNPVGRIVTRATNDVAAINEMFTSVLIYLFKDFLLIVGILLVMFKMNVRLTLVVLILAPFIVLVTYLFRIKVREAYRDVRAKIARINAYLQESISGIRIIKLFVQESRMFEGFKKINHDLYLANIRQLIVFAVFRPLIDIFNSLGIAIVLWYGGGQLIRSAISFGALVAFLTYIEKLFKPIMDLAEKYNILQSAMAASERIFKLLDEKPEPVIGFVKARLRGDIEFKNVWFAYEDENWVLKDVSFRIEPGKTIAIVGPTGSGKSTIINLILRFYENQKGRIIVDGRDIREYELNIYRSNFALVLQDVFLFSGSLEKNVRLWNTEIDDEKVKQALKMIGTDRILKRLIDKYEVGERGANLSVGERQIIAFARALAYDPAILILDEATSSVDSETEAIIQKATETLLKGRTSIVIAHRLSTIKRADKILVLFKGKIIETGKHEELMQAKGFYYHLYRLQFGLEEITEKRVGG